MEKIVGLTKEQKSKLPVYREKWMNIGLSTEKTDREKANKAIDEVYKCAGLNPPKLKIWLRSPYEGVIGAWYLKYALEKVFEPGDQVRDQVVAQVVAQVSDQVRNQVVAQVWDQVWAQVRDQVWAQVGDQVWAQVWAQVWNQVWDQVRNQVRDQVWDQVGAQVWNQVRDQVWDQVGNQVRNQVVAQVGNQVGDLLSYTSRCDGLHDANWLGFYDFFGSELDLKCVNKLSGLMMAAEQMGWFWPFENAVVMTEKPISINRDEQHRLHSETGAALKYSDGWGVYAWHGVRIPSEWIEDRQHLTPEIALKCENVEQRRAACEMLGWSNVLEHPSLNPKIIDEDEPHIGTLIQVDLPDAPQQWFLKYRCGTGRWFAEAVNDKVYDTALKANAGGNGWRGQGDPMSFIPFIRT